MRRKVRLVPGLAALALLLSACIQNSPQDALNPQGPTARQSYDLFVPVFWIAVGIFVLVEGALVFLVIRYRHRKGREGIPSQIHGNTRLEIAWTIVPALIFAVVAVPTVTTIFDLARKPSGDVLEVNVLGHQWWWEFEYPGLGINTANELHIPVGKPIYLTLCGAGAGYEGSGVPSECQPGPPEGQSPATVGAAVIHSFWVPEISAGTQDVIPGRVSNLTLQADEPGVYQGSCKELCGFSHANMRFTVVAQTQEDFDAWVRAQQQDAATPAGSLAAAGMDLFLNGSCIQCHAIQGTAAAANGGPNLTHFASRECFAGCMFENTPEELARWLEDPPARKPGSFMPDYDLSQTQIDALVAYLMSLE
ncbi:MAG: cytochrome c oxidase subunit II [Actinomycetota bacterium]